MEKYYTHIHTYKYKYVRMFQGIYGKMKFKEYISVMCCVFTKAETQGEVRTWAEALKREMSVIGKDFLNFNLFVVSFLSYSFRCQKFSGIYLILIYISIYCKNYGIIIA